MPDIECRALRDKIAAGEVKSLEATEAIFSNIEKYDGMVGAYISTFKEQALTQAPCDYEVGDKFLLSYDVIASSSYNLRVLVQNVTTGLFLESNIQVPISTTQERKNIEITSATPVSKGDIIKVFVHGVQIITSGEWFEINNVQFKKGFVPTPFIPKTVDEELRECLRYFERITAGTGGR